MVTCTQCRKASPMYDYGNGHLLCLNCHYLVQQAEAARQHAINQKLALLMHMEDNIVRNMAESAGLPPPQRRPIPQPVTIQKGPTLNNINIDRSVIGMLNTGQMQNVENISINVSSLVEAGQTEIAQALRQLTKAVAESQEISSEQRNEVLEQLEALSSQAALPQGQRKIGIIKSLLPSVNDVLSVAGKLSEVWNTYGPVIRAYFGI